MPHLHHDPGCCGHRGHHRDRDHDQVHGRGDPAGRPVRQRGRRRFRRGVRRADRDHHGRCDGVHDPADGLRGRGDPVARDVRHTAGRGATRDARRCRCRSGAGSRGGRRHDRSDRHCPDEAVRPLDRRRREEPTIPDEARTAAQAGVRRVARRVVRGAIRCAAPVGSRREAQAASAGLPVRHWPARRWRLRPRGVAAADHGAVEAPRRALPLSAAARLPSARAPTVRRDTDCRPHRNRGTARHWCGCGEWGVCVRSFENCEWYSGLRSDLEGSATPPQA